MVDVIVAFITSKLLVWFVNLCEANFFLIYMLCIVSVRTLDREFFGKCMTQCSYRCLLKMWVSSFAKKFAVLHQI